MSKVIDLSTSEDPKRTVIMVMRPHCKMGGAVAGDRVRLDASEMKLAPIQETVWSEADQKQYEAAITKAREELMRAAPNPTNDAINEQLAAMTAAAVTKAEKVKAAGKQPAK